MMVTRDIIRDQALRMGIATGEMPEVDFIWTVQKAEGNQPCFGQSVGCSSLNCRWRDSCVTLDSYNENAPAAAKNYSVLPTS